jgi:hypothetical protein
VSIEIRMSGPGADQELASLYNWLVEEPDVRSHARISLRAVEADPDEMGAGLDIIQLVVDSGFQALNLALAYATWRKSRQSLTRVTIEHDGTKVMLDGDGQEDVSAIVRVLM